MVLPWAAPASEEGWAVLSLWHTLHLFEYLLQVECEQTTRHQGVLFLGGTWDNLLKPTKIQSKARLVRMRLSFLFQSPRYDSVEEVDCDQELKIGGRYQHRPLRNTTLQVGSGRLFGLLLLCSLAAVSVSTLQLGRAVTSSNSIYPAPSVASCVRPTIRREWRTLNRETKNKYIEAVQCLSSKPSKLRDNGTLYDDFPWVHKLTAAKGLSRNTYV